MISRCIDKISFTVQILRAGVPNLRGLRAQFLNFSGSVKKRKASHTDGTSFAVITEDVRFYIRIKGNPGMKECQIRFGFLM